MMNRRAFLAGLTATAAGLMIPERKIWALDQSMISPDWESQVRDADLGLTFFADGPVIGDYPEPRPLSEWDGVTPGVYGVDFRMKRVPMRNVVSVPDGWSVGDTWSVKVYDKFGKTYCLTGAIGQDIVVPFDSILVDARVDGQSWNRQRYA